MSKNKPCFPDKPWLPDPSEWKGTWREDWRLMGQEGYLKDKTLEHRFFDKDLVFEDFDSCEFCYDDLEDPKRKVYYDPISRTWVCEKCFTDFKEYFHWTVVETE